ncbi:hypothetical protein LC040_15420 [Bacillus tianshenii]|nr:hypothetical protein LC040_15420 [Bacillus tianshenii]
MKSKISLFNTGLIKQDLRQHGWISIVYLIGLIFALPTQMLMIDSDEYRVLDDIETYFHIEVELQAFFLCTVPVAAGILLFRYLQTKEAADMMHSLPIKRGTLYFNHTLSGVIMLLLPVWLTAVITFFVSKMVSYSTLLTINDLMSWTVIVSMLTLFFFITTIFVGIVTGMSVAQGILTYILLFLPTGLLVMINYQLTQFLYGFSEYAMSAQYEKWSPIIRIFEMRGDTLSGMEMIFYPVMTVALFVFGLLLYKARHIETATQVITFQILRPLFKYGVTFCAMLLAGSYFASMRSGESEWLYVGYVIGAILGFSAAEMILQKSWRIFRPKLAAEMAGYAVIIALLVVAVKVDVFNYETHVPDGEVVEGVYYGYNVYELRNLVENDELAFSNDEQYIQNMRSLHEKVVTTQPEEPANHVQGQHFVIAYKMKDDSMMVREYTVPTQVITSQLKPVLESKPYKYGHFQLHILDKQADQIIISPSGVGRKRAVIAEPKEMEELKQILKKEILSLEYEEMANVERNWADIEVVVDTEDRMVQHYDWKKTYQKLEGWLKEKGYFANARVLPEDVRSIEVVKQEDASQYYYSPYEVFKNKESAQKVITSDEDHVIVEALNEAAQHGNGQYFVKFNLNHGESFFGVFTNEHMPKFLSQDAQENAG